MRQVRSIFDAPEELAAEAETCFDLEETLACTELRSRYASRRNVPTRAAQRAARAVARRARFQLGHRLHWIFASHVLRINGLPYS